MRLRNFNGQGLYNPRLINSMSCLSELICLTAVAEGASSQRPLPGTDVRDSQALNSDNNSNNCCLPAYSSGIELHEQNLDARAAFTGDGRVNIDIDQKNGGFSESLTSALAGPCPGYEPPPYHILKDADVLEPPSMSIVIQVVG